MKKISLSIIAVAALLVAVTFTGCTREESKNDNGPATLVLKIEQGVESRANVASVSNTTVTLSSGWVFVSNGVGRIVHALEIVATGITAGDGEVCIDDLIAGNGKAVFAIPSGATTVHVFGNVTGVTAWPAGVTAANAIGDDITTYTEGTKITVSNLSVTNGVANVPLYGSDGIAGGPSAFTSSPKVYPVAGRIEIAKISALKSNITAFTVDEIFINNYYPSRNFIGGLGDALVNNGTTVANYATSSPGKYEGLTAGELYDLDDLAAGDDSGTPPRMVAKPVSNILAYNLTAPTTDDYYFPHIVLKLTGVTTATDVLPKLTGATKYLTVKTATDVDGLISFKKGNIYKIADIQFSNTDLAETPEPQLGTLTVKATIVNWVINDIKVAF
jgi:hypothetical protein